MKPGINAPVSPRYAGEYHVFKSPLNRDVLLVDRAEIREGYGTLRWAAAQDDYLVKAILSAYNMEGFNGIRHPTIKASTLRQYAANLTGRAIERGLQGDLSAEDLGRAISIHVISETGGKDPLAWATEQGLEVPEPSVVFRRFAGLREPHQFLLDDELRPAEDQFEQCQETTPGTP